MNTLDARRRLLGRNVYKRTTEGNPAIAQGSLARMYPGIAMQGWTEQDSTEGKNLFDKSKIEDRIDTTHTQTDTGVEVSGLYYVTYRVSVDPNTDMYISYNKSGEGLNQISVYGTDTSADNFISSSYSKGMKFNTGNHTEILVLFYSGVGTENVSIYNDVMLNLGATALPYEPYTGNKPSPSPDYPQPITSAGKYDEESQKYEYGIELAGKNLLDEKSVAEVSNVLGITIEWLEDEKCFLLNGTCTHSEAFAITDINVKGNVGSYYTASVYRISGDVLIPEGGFCTAYFGVNDSPTSGGSPRENWMAPHVENGNNNSITKVLNNKYINTFWFYITEGVSLVNYKINVMLELRTKQTAYELYRLPQTVTLTSDRPLTKWDKLEKRNGQWGWVYKSNTVTIDGSEVWLVYGSGFHTPMALLETYTRTHGVCEQGDVKAYDSTDGVYGQNSIWLGVNNSNIYWNENPYFNAELEDSGIENWKNHLSQNPAVIWYETAEETFVPLSENEQELMNALHTFRPTTVLSNDVDCNMTLTYKTKKSMGGG